ncbi:MAG TPA: AI-2E family transporter [Candidatus Udaeobacter sp.]|jgi:predicted PurR-regulated permease PerM/methylmalonyl-CoA mutase cobalamin-binding subunit
MRTRITPLTPSAALTGIWGLLLLALIVAALYFGRTVLVPIALATLITFLLSRLVTRVEPWIGRVAAVLVTVIAMFAIFAAASWVIGRQVIDLAEKLPDYQANIVLKIRSLKLPSAGPLARFSRSVNLLQNELVEPNPAPVTEPRPGGLSTNTAPPVASPIPVKVIEGRSAIPQLMQETIGAILSPLGTAALVLLLVIFMLLKREDIRGRLIRLVGQGRISTTTRAMEDAGRRVSRYLVTQFLVNTCYGICVASGLHFIGVPNAALWGLLAGVLRFVPYVGPWVGALLPVLLSFAISTSWFTPLMTIGLFIVLEVIVSNFIEPWVYGANTGVSPIALIISAVFWTWLWGPVGLVLSNPLTVCLAVIGRHVPRLEFLAILLSEDQPLAPHEEFYHRLLSFSMDSAEEFSVKYAETESLLALYDNVLIPTIAVVETDGHNGSLGAEQRTAALQRIHETIDDFGVWQHSRNRGEEEKEDEIIGVAPTVDSRVLCLPASAYRDELAGEMLAQLLRRRGFQAENLPARFKHEELIDRIVELRPECICISVLPPTSIAQARNLTAAIRDRLGSITTLVGVWSSRLDADKLKERLRAADVNEVAVSLTDAVRLISKMAAGINDEMLPAPTPPNEEARVAELNGLNLLDTPPESDFDHVTERLTKLFRVPIALITLIDKKRQWFKSQTGLPAELAEDRCIAREVSICGHVIANDEVLIVRDLSRDPRFANNPFVKDYGLRFYAGVPLRGPNGFPVGSLCILDTKPRNMTSQERDLLKMIAADVMEQIKRRPVAEIPKAPASEKV